MKSEGLSFIRPVILSVIAQEFTAGHHLMHTLLTHNFSLNTKMQSSLLHVVIG